MGAAMHMDFKHDRYGQMLVWCQLLVAPLIIGGDGWARVEVDEDGRYCGWCLETVEERFKQKAAA